MPLSALDPRIALIVIDLQKGIVHEHFIHPIGEIIDRTRALLDVFRAKNLPVLLVNVAGRASGRTEQGPYASTMPERGRVRSRDCALTGFDLFITGITSK